MSCSAHFVRLLLVVACVGMLALSGCENEQVADSSTSTDAANGSGSPPGPPVMGKPGGLIPPGRAKSGTPAQQTGGGNQAAPSLRSRNNLKQIGLALHNFHDVYRAFPGAYSVDQNGKPLLSWRVHILPYVEELALYRQFKLDEPWDSPHNQALIAQMPDVYRTQGVEAGKTVYLGNAAEKGVFAPPTNNQRGPKSALGIGLRDIRDGTANTIAVVEASQATAATWTKPDDYVPNAEDPVAGLDSGSGHILVLFCDGSTQYINTAKLTDPEFVKSLKAAFTRDASDMFGGL